MTWNAFFGHINCISTELHTVNSTVWPVPYACAQPYHPRQWQPWTALHPFRSSSGVGRCASVLKLVFIGYPFPLILQTMHFVWPPLLSHFFFVMDPLQVLSTMAPSHLIKKWKVPEVSTGGPSSVHNVLILFCILKLSIAFDSMYEFEIWNLVYFELTWTKFEINIQKWKW